MRKTLGVMVVTAVAMMGWLSVAPADDAPPAAEQPAVEQPAPGLETPLPEILQVPAQPNQEAETSRRVAKQFAPWMEAVIQEKSNVANRLFPLRRAAQDAVESPNALRIFRKFPKLDGLKLSLVGARGFGEQCGTMLFTITTETGPVAIKLSQYQFKDSRYIGKVEVTDDWEEIEKMYLTVDPLPSPAVVAL